MNIPSKGRGRSAFGLASRGEGRGARGEGKLLALLIHYEKLCDMRGYEDLLVWQKAVELSIELYQHTNLLPDTEKFGLKSQMQRSAVSIPSNIAEGYERSSKDFARFLDIALGSAGEVHTQMIIASKVYNLCNEKILENLFEVRRMIQGLHKKILARAEEK